MSDNHHSPKGTHLNRKNWEKTLATIVATSILTGIQIIKAILIFIFNIITIFARA